MLTSQHMSHLQLPGKGINYRLFEFTAPKLNYTEIPMRNWVTTVYSIVCYTPDLQDSDIPHFSPMEIKSLAK